MERSPQLYLSEIERWAEYLVSRAQGRTVDDYLADLDFRLAVEWAFILMGEAMVLLRRHHPDVSAILEGSAGAIGFRNFLVHQYWNIDNRDVWAILKMNAAPLRESARELMARLDAEG